jgi:hypothetical protein
MQMQMHSGHETRLDMKRWSRFRLFLSGRLISTAGLAGARAGAPRRGLATAVDALQPISNTFSLAHTQGKSNTAHPVAAMTGRQHDQRATSKIQMFLASMGGLAARWFRFRRAAVSLQLPLFERNHARRSP